MRTFIVGVTQPDWGGLRAYLEYTGQTEFMSELEAWRNERPGDPLCLVSFYAKLCYKSLTEGKNANVKKIRGIVDNLTGVIRSGHGSVFEHVSVNFVTTGVSRVFTHELVRHRAGTAFSQTSGRYVSIDKLDMVLPPELQDNVAYHDCPKCEGKDRSCDMCDVSGNITIDEYVKHGIEKNELFLKRLRKMLIKDDASFDEKKKLTSAIRRLAPNGQENEIGWTCNVRALRHIIELRTGPGVEWEIRQVISDIAAQVLERWPLMLERPGVTADNWIGLRI